MGNAASRRPGAPRRLIERQAVSVSLDKPTLDKLAFLCQRLEITRSEALRILVAKARLPKRRPQQPPRKGKANA